MPKLNPSAPPALFLPPTDQAHDIYALSAQIEGFDYLMYQDIQQDQHIFDSLQRWPYLFSLAIEPPESTKYAPQRVDQRLLKH
ncbi:MAG: hypothetical protein HC848_01805 [Limnobacter sp.]|nr:hypothetical protein [Limnobacter sp.]